MAEEPDQVRKNLLALARQSNPGAAARLAAILESGQQALTEQDKANLRDAMRHATASAKAMLDAATAEREKAEADARRRERWLKFWTPIATALRSLLLIVKNFIAWTRKPPTPEQMAKRTERARKELQAAKDYMDKFHGLQHDRDKENYLRFSAERIEKARRLDPDVTLIVDIKGEPATWTIKHFSAASLFTEAQYQMRKRKWASAKNNLLKAQKFRPDEPLIADELAECYIQMNRRWSAKKVLDAVEYPTPRTHELLDRLRGDRWLGNPIKPWGIFALAGVATWFAPAFFDFAYFVPCAFLGTVLVIIGTIILSRSSGTKFTYNPDTGNVDEEKLRPDKHEL